MSNSDSILISIKKLHGISEEDVSFDTDIMIHINSALMILNQLGVGPSTGYFIQDAAAKWSDYMDDPFIVESIKSFIYISVRLVFDPPTSATVKEALTDSCRKYAWYITEWIESRS